MLQIMLRESEFQTVESLLSPTETQIQDEEHGEGFENTLLGLNQSFNGCYCVSGLLTQQCGQPPSFVFTSLERIRLSVRNSWPKKSNQS